MDIAASLLVNLSSPFLCLANVYFKFKSLQASEPFDAQKKIIVITGASSGIGEDMAKLYANENAQLVLVARRAAPLNAVADACRQLGAKDVVTVEADVSVEEDLRRIVKTAETLGDIDCLVLNAGISMDCTVSDLSSTADIRRVMDTNFYGSSLLAYYALPSLLKSAAYGGGRIVVVSSIYGFVAGPDRSAYCASKFALKGFFDSLRMENPSLRITVAYPGYVRTDLDRTRVMGKSKVAPVVASKQKKAMSSEECARAIVNAVKLNQRDAVFEFKYKLAYLIKDYFPYLLEKLVRITVDARRTLTKAE